TAVSGQITPNGTAVPLTENHKTAFSVIHTHQPQVTVVTADTKPPVQNPRWLVADDPFTSILLPIILSETTYGLVELIKRDIQPLNSRDLPLLSTLANQANIALETAFVFEETFERERFYNALGAVNLAINFTLELDTVLNLICSESLRIFNLDGAYIWLREGNQFIGTTAKGHAENEFAGKVVNTTEKDVFVTLVANTRQAQYVNNISQAKDVRFKLPQRETIQAALGVPLEQEGDVVGVLILIDKNNPYRFSAKDVAQATTFGVQAAIALQNARLFAELRELNEDLDMRVAKRTQALHEESNRVKILLRITSELSASLDQDRVLNQALHLVNEVVNATQGVILLIDQETGELVFRAAFGAERKPGPRGLPSGLMRNEGLAGWMIDNRSSVIVHDTRQDPRWVERATSRDHRSVLAVPLMTGEEVIGVLMLFHGRPNAFTMQQLDLVEAAAIQVANAINNANLYLLIRDQAERLGQTLHLEQINTAKNQAILESIADGVIVADAENKIILANLPAGSILGVRREELVGKYINEFLGLYGQSQHSWLSTIKEWSKNADRVEEWTYIDDQLPIEEKVVSVHLSPVMAGKQFFGTVSIFRDITKEVELDRLKSEFVSTVSHELRTPMTSIKGYVDLMLMGAAGKMSDAQTRYLQVIKNNAERLHMLVNDLLDISRIETGKTTLDLRPVDIAQLVEQVVEAHLRGRIQHENKPITVITDTPSNLPLVNIDHARVTQVLTNLLDNAFNYTPPDGEIRVTARENGNYVFISVSDTGIGISKEDQTKIFDRFYRAEHEVVQKVSGTGLGLAIVRSLVEMHNGQLTVESAPGSGSTFTFNLPIVVEDSETA
ncbi:MAG: GAF domain-containing protein, partial [Anaerolineales bacterium]|nr:GAF domain-containing protein [Anaerolineales bacterium]